MSVLIKGVEMPTSCRECWLKMNCDDCVGWECVCVPLHQPIGYLDYLPADKRRDDCPLVPVPPHGRLIDADALIQDKGIDTFSAVFAVASAPTVIEADEDINVLCKEEDRHEDPGRRF